MKGDITTTLRLPGSLHREIGLAAIRQGESMATWLRQAARERLDKEKHDNQRGS